LVTLYTTHCPQCAILENLLKEKGIEYSTVDDTYEMIQLGIRSAPCLGVDDKIMKFPDAYNWVQNGGNN